MSAFNKFALLFLVLMPVIFAGKALALETSVTKADLAPGADVYANVNVTGTVGVESDIASASSQPTVAGGKVPIGTINSPGIYFVRLVAADRSETSICILATKSGSKITVQSVGDGRVPASAPADKSLVQKFMGEIAKNNYAAAKKGAAKAVHDYVPGHVVETTGTVTVCLLPGGELICIDRIGNQATDLAIEIVNDTVNECAGLSPAEKTSLHNWIQAGKSIMAIKEIAGADGALDAFIATGKATVAVASFKIKQKGGDDAAVSVIGSNALGLIDKTAVILKVTKP